MSSPLETVATPEATSDPRAVYAADGWVRGRIVTSAAVRLRLMRGEAALLLVAATSAGLWSIYRQVVAGASTDAWWTALAYAAIVPPALIAMVVWLNRMRPLPWPLLATGFIWGAFGATAIALYLNTWLAPHVGDSVGGTARSAVFLAPWTEEFAKALVVLAVAAWAGYRFDSVTSGAVVGAMSGIGFAFVENVFYYSSIYQATAATGAGADASDAVFELFLLRGIVSPFVHPLFTMATGVGVGLAVRHCHAGLRITAPVAGFLMSALLHMGYNSLASFTDKQGFRVAYLLVLLPALAAVVGLVVAVRRHETGVLHARLRDYVRHGWMPEPHVYYGLTWRGHREAKRYARGLGRDHGRTLRAWRRDLQRLAVERDRMVRGVADHAASAEESRLLERLREHRRRLVLPAADDASDRRLVRASSSW